MAYDRHRAGARGEALAVAWLANRDWYVFTAWQKQSPCDLVAVKLRGVAPAEVMLLEVRYVFYVTASFDPRSGRVCEVFITGRGKTGSPLNDTLYEMGLWISETIQAHDDLEMKEC